MIPISFWTQLIRLFSIIFSSPVFIGLVIIFALLATFIFLNVQRRNLVVNIALTIIFISLLVFTIIGYRKSIIAGLDYVIEVIIYNLYFPSFIGYAIALLFSYIMLILTLFNKKFSLAAKRINGCFFAVIQCLFSIFLITVVTNDIDLSNRVIIYSNSTITTLLQVSMMMIVFWLFSLFLEHYIQVIKQYFPKKNKN